jgi:nucleoside-diphosphate-sugar epimerase
MSKKNRILIIGSEGAVGQAIYEVLNATGNNIIFRLGRSLPKQSYDEDNFLYVDLDTFSSCQRVEEKYCFDTVIYLAGIWKGKTLEMQNLFENAFPFFNFINTIAKSAKHIIYFSSSAVYGKRNIFNENLLNEMPDSSYGVSKLLSERFLVDFCKKNSKQYTIFRPFHITSLFEKYNPGRSHVVTDFIYKISNHIELNKDGFEDIWIPFTWAHDIGLSIKKCIENSHTYDQIFNIGSSYTYSLAQLERLVVNSIFKDNNKKEDFDLTPKQVNYFNKSNEIIGGCSVTKLSHMVNKYVAFNNIGNL